MKQLLPPKNAGDIRLLLQHTHASYVVEYNFTATGEGFRVAAPCCLVISTQFFYRH